ncbi:MAG: hypothetical protein EBT20_20825 [Alphaproteobacteria bacterium]|nr:hypothetical protein [Alphaproteobacteria bacterium]
MAKLSQKKQLHKDAVLVSGTITTFIMNNMVEAMVRANVTDKKILDAIAVTKKRVQLLERMAPNNLAKDMVTESTEWFGHYGQTWLDECRLEEEVA